MEKSIFVENPEVFESYLKASNIEWSSQQRNASNLLNLRWIYQKRLDQINRHENKIKIKMRVLVLIFPIKPNMQVLWSNEKQAHVIKNIFKPK